MAGKAVSAEVAKELLELQPEDQERDDPYDEYIHSQVRKSNLLPL